MDIDGLKHGYQYLEDIHLNTMQHAIEIIHDLKDDVELRKIFFEEDTSFLTADSVLYRVEQGCPVMYFGKRDINLILRNLEKVEKQGLSKYEPKEEEVQEVIRSVEEKKTIRIELNEMNLEGSCYSKNYDTTATFLFRTEFWKINTAQESMLVGIFGESDIFKENMKMLRNEGIDEILIEVVHPKSVIDNGHPIVRSCALQTSFSLEGRYFCFRTCESVLTNIEFDEYRVRAIPKEDVQ